MPSHPTTRFTSVIKSFRQKNLPPSSTSLYTCRAQLLLTIYTHRVDQRPVLRPRLGSLLASLGLELAPASVRNVTGTVLECVSPLLEVLATIIAGMPPASSSSPSPSPSPSAGSPSSDANTDIGARAEVGTKEQVSVVVSSLLSKVLLPLHEPNGDPVIATVAPTVRYTYFLQAFFYCLMLC